MGIMDDVMEVRTTPTEDKRVSIKDILDQLFDNQTMEQKSYLFDIHVQSIMKLNSTNMYLEETFGFRIPMYDQLIFDKLMYVISINGRGRNDVIRLVEAMREQVLADSGVEERRRFV